MCSFSSPWVIKVEQKSEVVLLFLLTLLLPVLCFKPVILENTLMLSVTIIGFSLCAVDGGEAVSLVHRPS